MLNVYVFEILIPSGIRRRGERNGEKMMMDYAVRRGPRRGEMDQGDRIRITLTET